MSLLDQAGKRNRMVLGGGEHQRETVNKSPNSY